MSSRRAVKLAHLAWLVPLLGLVEAGAHRWFSQRAPTPDEWQALRPAISELRRPGDVVVVAPQWAEPLARWKLGDALMPLADVARPDETRYARAIEISTLGARAPSLGGFRLASEARHGKFDVRVLENPAPPVISFDFTSAIDPAHLTVETRRAGKVAPCNFTDHAPVESGGLGGPPTYPSSRFRCEGEPTHIFAGVTIIDDERELPRRCIWAHPPSGGELVLRFAKVPLGRVIRGHTGMGWLIEREKIGAPIRVHVLVDGEEIGRAERVDGDGWKLFELPLGAHASTVADVEWRVETSNADRRHLCFEADSR